MRKLAAVFVLAVSLTACYHATVNTGRPPSAMQVERSWAHGWLYGLVPPSDLNVGEQCPNGVAQVETELSFANQLAAILTGWIYTPMTIVATCAS